MTIKEPHFTPKKILSMLGLKDDSLGPYALIPGGRERSHRLLAALEQPKKNFTFLDYQMYTGMLAGKRVTVGNGGRFAPDSALTTEILCAGGAEWLIRVGSCGSLQEGVQIGDVVIVTEAIRGEGTTSYYVSKNFSTVACPDVVNALTKAAENVGLPHHVGRIFTTDALFQETPELIGELHRQNISCIDMVTSTFLTIAQLRHKKAGAILAVSDECLYGRFGFREPAYLAAEQKMLQVAQQALHYL
jgi:uridine phosphorylase